MGQSQTLPLPELIPMPGKKLLKIMNDLGFTIDNDGQKYVAYTMPNGWKIRNNSYREDLPVFHFVDENNMVQISITDAWKETYDNELEIYKIKPYLYKPMIGEMISNETNIKAKLAEFKKALNQ